MPNQILPKPLALGLTAITAVVLTSCSGVSAAPQPLQAPTTVATLAPTTEAGAGAASPATATTGASAAIAAVATAEGSTAAAAGTATSAATTAPEAAGTPVSSTATAAPTAVEASAAAATTVPTAAATSAPTATTAPAAATAPTPVAQATPVCTPGALTPALTEGPYYKSNPPQTSSLYQPGMAGTKLTITGYVLNADCQPIPGARVDFWQADASGQYDNSGYTLRGYQLTDAQGRYTVVTVVPGLYPGRTEHIHVKVTPPGGQTLTTQLFFPGVAQNNSDGIFAAQNVLKIQAGASGETATFDFVVQG